MNKITLIGNLVRDPELSVTPNGVSVCRFTIAVNRKFQKDTNGEKITDFFRIVAWRQQAEFCSNYLAKGRKVAVVGELQATAYVGKDGEPHPSLDVALDEIEFLTPKSEGQMGSEGSSQERYSPSANQQNANSQNGFVDVDDDSLPF